MENSIKLDLVKDFNESHHEFSKETEKKYRWDTTDDHGAVFSLYIPKWRVPKPIPMSITVSLYLITEGRPCNLVPRTIAERYPSKCSDPINAIVSHKSDHTKTARYEPKEDEKTREIGEPYIPYALIPNGGERDLLIEVNWD